MCGFPWSIGVGPLVRLVRLVVYVLVSESQGRLASREKGVAVLGEGERVILSDRLLVLLYMSLQIV